MKRSAAEILREYGPFPGVNQVHGVAYDGQHVWFASGDRLNAFDPEDLSAPPIYFVLLRWDGGKLIDIRDFRYARYAAEGAEFVTLA